MGPIAGLPPWVPTRTYTRANQAPGRLHAPGWYLKPPPPRGSVPYAKPYIPRLYALPYGCTLVSTYLPTHVLGCDVQFHSECLNMPYIEVGFLLGLGFIAAQTLARIIAAGFALVATAITSK